MRFAVLQFGGSNCDLDTHFVLQEVCGVDTDLIWYKDRLKISYDALIIPGGFSYGDYLRSHLVQSADQDLEQESRRLLERNGFLAADWESASIAAVCKLNKIKCLILRGSVRYPWKEWGPR
jgi:phosphoribosylformylglycinamidine synthase